MASLKKRAEELGIDIDGRWGDARLKEEIAKAEKTGQTSTKPGPGNPDEKVKADPGKPEGFKTEKTPKMVHSTMTAAPPREITNNDVPDQSMRRPLLVEAEHMGIYVDPKWDDARLRAELQMSREGRADLQVKGAVPPAEWGSVGYDTATAGGKAMEATPEKIKTGKDEVPVLLVRDYWPDEGNRVPSGVTIAVDREKAKAMIANGAAERADPL